MFDHVLISELKVQWEENTVYNLVSKTDKIGYYNELYGGFFQGFYKLFGYDYEVFPERVEKG